MQEPKISIQTEIQVPSGKLVYQEFLDEMKYGVATNAAVRAGVVAERESEILENAKNGIFSGFIGNSCPGVYRQGDRIIVGNDPDEEGYNRKKGDFGEKVGHIITDGGTYSFADLDNFLHQGGNLNKSTCEHQNPKVLEVTPGRYVLNHFYGFNTEQRNAGKVLYASIERSDRPLI
ncbi:hypothetical protein GOV14_03930 [Candidatus Pacearchaeota archaeon]|nr:hypothetical protein [Candidatus Pacearchaeota archaeon]